MLPPSPGADIITDADKQTIHHAGHRHHRLLIAMELHRAVLCHDVRVSRVEQSDGVHTRSAGCPICMQRADVDSNMQTSSLLDFDIVLGLAGGELVFVGPRRCVYRRVNKEASVSISHYRLSVYLHLIIWIGPPGRGCGQGGALAAGQVGVRRLFPRGHV